MNTIVIDDSGSPGSKIESKFLVSTRKTWAAVFIESNIVDKVNTELAEINESLTNSLGISELHFTDLINGNNEYSALNQKERLELFHQFCMYYRDYQFPFFIQTTNPETLAENGLILKAKKMPYGGLDLTKFEHQGLLLLLIKVKAFLTEKSMLGKSIDFLVDEGLKKAGTKLSLPIFQDMIGGTALRFGNSKSNKLIQIADFIAYSINRTQTTLVKPPEDRTEFDKEILILISEALGKSAVSGISYAMVDPNKTTADDYDYEQIVKRQEDGNLDKYKFYKRNIRNL